MSNEHATASAERSAEHGLGKALEILRACRAPEGFLASPSDTQNYRRIWARDGSIIALAALMTDEEDLIATARQTFLTLAQHQGAHGEIPSNVDPMTKRVSYGGTTGRVDADLWFVIGCAEYWQGTSDQAFLSALLPTIEKVRFLLGAWEFNDRGLLYVPLTGDWADEYLHHGYVLYDQLLYLQAQRALGSIHRAIHGSTDHCLQERIDQLYHTIRANYWFNSDGIPDDVYHEVLYRKGLQAADHCGGQHWMASFSPSGYSYRFDGLANVLASLLEIADEDQRRAVDDFIAREVVNNTLPLLPGFHPVIKPVDEDWMDLQMMFSYTFKNKPYEYHNGGLWPMVTGFYVADLAARQREVDARRYLQAIHNANALEMADEAWGFPEYVQGRDLTAGGTRHQGWSAAAAIIGHYALTGRRPFRIGSLGG